MIQIAKTSIPVNKKIHISLTYVYGIGTTTAKKICENAKVDLEKRTKDLTKDEVSSIVKECESFKLNEELKKEIILNKQRLISIKCNKGRRYIHKLPVRGQNTKSNAKSAKRCQ